MNILFTKHFFLGFMVSEIPRVSVFGHCPYSVTFPYVVLMRDYHLFIQNYIRYFLNIILRHIVMVRTGLEPVSYPDPNRIVDQ